MKTRADLLLLISLAVVSHYCRGLSLTTDESDLATGHTYYVIGEIDAEDVSKFRALTSTYQSANGLEAEGLALEDFEFNPSAPDTGRRRIFYVDSPGGNVAAAIEIGRLLREMRAWVIIPVNAKCYSACVFLLAGGTLRNAFGQVGIHRPFGQSVGDIDYADAQRSFDAIRSSARRYLAEMNLPDSLFEAMVNVPPQEIRLLSREEVAAFRLDGVDPVEQEVTDAKGAARYGISRLEYLERRERVKNQCRPYTLELSKLGIAEARGQSIDHERRDALEREWGQCIDDVMHGRR